MKDRPLERREEVRCRSPQRCKVAELIGRLLNQIVWPVSSVFYAIYILYRYTNIKLTSVLESSVEFDSRLGAGVILVMRWWADNSLLKPCLKNQKGRMSIMGRCIKFTSVQWSELNKCFKRLKHCIKNTKTFTRNDKQVHFSRPISLI